MSIEDKLVFGEIYQTNIGKNPYVYLGIQTCGGVRHVMATKNSYSVRVISFKDYKKEDDQIKITPPIGTKKVRPSEEQYIAWLLQNKLDAREVGKQK